MRWQAAQVRLDLCSSKRWRTLRTVPVADASFKEGTFGGGGGGGAPSKFSRIHFPRMTGEVLLATDVTVRILAWPNSPRRFSSVTFTRRSRLPSMFGIPYSF